jgi:hypothetical protein
MTLPDLGFNVIMTNMDGVSHELANAAQHYLAGRLQAAEHICAQILGGLKSEMQLRPPKGPHKISVGESIAGSFQWVKSLANFPLGTESQRCRVILRWKSVIA